MKLKYGHMLSLACFMLFLAVALGAFGAHGLKELVTGKYLETYKTGVTYHFYHSFALLILPIIGKTFNINVRGSFYFFIAGIILFSFNCYLYAILQVKTFAMIVPLGGFSFLIGWLMLALTTLKTSEG
ncbi:DUF423 domain-containing protein [Halobacteriovorax sp. GB3]|uniref:DUF423 domain-containing protein n=1 Tax=Halobacteriovorax sp. GB3 TaxID=2719615 RepID=UPI00235DF3AE|nr:DUF423 domain-containing protein [Halobacteriovorax sp. GB3]MDD0852190.1 DUF423 domain-containing protein [Halobacteriovorax sp. GB3]